MLRPRARLTHRRDASADAPVIGRIETDRLCLRPFELADAEAAHEWFGDEFVMKYTPSGPDPSVLKTRQRLATYQEHQSKHGFSKWLITDRQSGRPIGDAGLLHQPDQGWLDLGYRLSRSWWGKGLATEAASAWVSAAAGTPGLPPLVAIVHPENAASIRVLEKLGFYPERRDIVMGMPAIVFVMKTAAAPAR